MTFSVKSTTDTPPHRLVVDDEGKKDGHGGGNNSLSKHLLPNQYNYISRNAVLKESHVSIINVAYTP